MKYIHIRNWDTFQHRDTTRNQKTAAPWIKEYVGQLHDPDYLGLTFAQRGILHGLRLMYAASRGRGLIWTQTRTRLCTNKGESRHFLDNLTALNHAGFIEFLDSKLPADSAQSASLDVDTDVEGDVEKNKPGAVRELDHPRETEANGTAPDLTIRKTIQASLAAAAAANEELPY